MPVEGFLKERLLSVVPEKFIDRQFNRDDASATRAVDNTIWTDLVEAKQWVMAVPLLPQWGKKKDKAEPRYLIAPAWYNSTATIAGKKMSKKLTTPHTNPSPFPHLTYLQTPTADIRPICKMCPRFILHQNGQCRVGDEVCFEALPLGIKNYFKEGLDTPAPSTNVTEPEEEQIINGIVPADNSRKNRIRTSKAEAP
jgi:hypothetical protein